MSPLTSYIKWLSTPNGTPFPEDAKCLNSTTILNLVQDDYNVLIVLNEILNKNHDVYHNVDIEKVGMIHKKLQTVKKLNYVSNRPKIEKINETAKKIMELSPYLKKDEAEALSSKPEISKELNTKPKKQKRRYVRTTDSNSNKRSDTPEMSEEEFNARAMLVNVYYKYDYKSRTGETSYVTRIDDFRIIKPIDDTVDIYYGTDDFLNVSDISRLKHEKIRYPWKKKKIEDLKSNGYAVYGADVDIATQKSYEWKKTHPNEKQYKLRIAYVDIELFQKGYGIVDFTNVKESALTIPINLITIYDNYLNKYFTLVYNLNKNTIKKEQILEYLNYKDENLDVRIFDREEDMLLDFFQIFRDCDPDICTGWNSDEFDIPYIKFRSDALRVPTMMRFDKAMQVNYKEKMNKYQEIVTYAIPELGYTIPLDFQRCYKELSSSKKENYKLNTIAKIELGIEKLNVEEGMDDIFINEPERFIAYNINDVHLVRKLEDKLKFIDLCFNIVKFSNIGWNRVYTKLHICDGLIYEYLMDRKKTVKVSTYSFNKDKPTEKRAKRGAYVRDPLPGIHEYSGDLDATSMYPYIMARFNISADTYVGRIEEPIAHEYLYDKDKFLSYDKINLILKNAGAERTYRITPTKFEESMKANGYIITHIGTIFMKHENRKSIFYDIVDMLISKRKEYKDLMKQNLGKDKMLYQRYDGMQKTIKVITNSLYGGQAAEEFRMFSFEVTESITMTGRELIKLAAVVANRCIDSMICNKTEKINPVTIDASWITECEGILPNVIYGDSVTGDTVIDTNEGKIKIADLWDYKVKNELHLINEFSKQEHIVPNNLKSLSLKSTSESEMKKISYIMKHPTSKKLYEISDEFGNKVIVTEDHSIMVMRDNQLIPTKPFDIRDDDKIIINYDN